MPHLCIRSLDCGQYNPAQPLPLHRSKSLIVKELERELFNSFIELLLWQYWEQSRVWLFVGMWGWDITCPFRGGGMGIRLGIGIISRWDELVV